jgi:hypothetical protein
MSVVRLRDVIDLPEPPEFQVTHHRIFKGWCTQCQRWHEAPIAWQEETPDQGRMRVRFTCVLA